MSALTDLLSADGIRLDAEAEDWRSAVRASGQVLVDEGISTAEYTEAMVRNVEENGPYIVIAPGFALAHTRPFEAVLRTGMSWVRLASPVAFGHETNDPVQLVVALAAVDSKAHTAALAALAKVLADGDNVHALQQATSPQEVLRVLEGQPTGADGQGGSQAASAKDAAPAPSEQKILTVCGNGVGTSLFLKNTLEQVLDRWGWSRQVSVEATDTISAKGKASEAVAILTSQEIARTLGDVGIPVKVVHDFSSTTEVDAVLRDTYDV